MTFAFVSVHPELNDRKNGIKCDYFPGMPLLEYRKFMKDNNFDIGLAPLEIDKFSKCKYFNKYIEYTTQGVVGIYSDTEPYTYVVKDGINGFLAHNTPESWYEKLKEAIQDASLRKECLNNAIAYLRENHTEEAAVNDRI